MTLKHHLREYVERIKNGGDSFRFNQPLSNHNRTIWVSWRTTESGETCLDIRVDNEQYGYFVNGKPAQPSWEGGIRGPDVAEWDSIRKL